MLKDVADAADVSINVLIKVGLVALVGVILFFPYSMPILRRVVVKSSEINIEGVKLEVIDAALNGTGVDLTSDGRLTIGGVDVSTLPDQNAKLRQTVSDLTDQIAKLNGTIQQQQQLLTQANRDVVGAAGRVETPSLPPPSPGAAPNRPISPAPPPKVPTAEEILASAIQKSAAIARQDQASSAAASQRASEIVQQSTSLPGVGFGIVFGAELSPAAAMDEVKKVSADPVILYKRQGSWRSVAYFGTRKAANEDLPRIKSVKADAYIVDISLCPAQFSVPIRSGAEHGGAEGLPVLITELAGSVDCVSPFCSCAASWPRTRSRSRPDCAARGVTGRVAGTLCPAPPGWPEAGLG